jgi:hypothetical protein
MTSSFSVGYAQKNNDTFLIADSNDDGVTAFPKAVETVQLPGFGATMDDCCRIWELLLGGPPSGDTGEKVPC